MQKLQLGEGKTWALGIKLKLNHPFGWRMGSCIERAGNGLMTLSTAKV